MTLAPYGSWSSPITPASLTAAFVGLAAPALKDGGLYWLESHPDQGGRVSLWCRGRNGGERELTKKHYVRTRVHEYGGGEYAVGTGEVVFSSFPDGRVFRCRAAADPVPLTAGEPFRFADLRVHPDRNLVLAVREDHSGAGEPVNTIVAVRLDGPEDQIGTVLCADCDFYSSPELSDDGRLAWTQWNHPDMPWDATAIMVGRFDADTVHDVTRVAGGPGEAAIQPRWAGDRLIFASDRSGWANLYAWTSSGVGPPLHPADTEFARPQWVLGDNPYAVVDSDHLLCSASRGGETSLGLLALSSRSWTPVPLDGSTSAVVVEGDRAAAVVTYGDRPSELVVLDLPSGRPETIRVSSATRLDPDLVSSARLVTWSSPEGGVYGWFYPPTNPSFSAAEGSAPPLLTVCHGGPTGFSDPGFRPSTQFWTSRGLAVLEVNYGGSAGYGRAYRERLKGNWGIVDVRDCADGARAAADQGLADGDRLVIMGGSAGGYTALRALTTGRTFAAGISLYGVGDLEALARDTHKFESRYLDGLVGPYPAARDVYVERSPISHVNQLSAPMLLLQGTEDKVVPPEQSATMAAAARAKRLPVGLVMFEGEGHGFRRAESIQASYEAQLFFLGRVLGFDPADDLPGIEIENEPTQSTER
jgi:dipeptidyl aminopeptidase/acylaminoacyl peptidase